MDLFKMQGATKKSLEKHKNQKTSRSLTNIENQENTLPEINDRSTIDNSVLHEPEKNDNDGSSKLIGIKRFGASRRSKAKKAKKTGNNVPQNETHDVPQYVPQENTNKPEGQESNKATDADHDSESTDKEVEVINKSAEEIKKIVRSFEELERSLSSGTPIEYQSAPIPEHFGYPDEAGITELLEHLDKELLNNTSTRPEASTSRPQPSRSIIVIDLVDDSSDESEDKCASVESKGEFASGKPPCRQVETPPLVRPRQNFFEKSPTPGELYTRIHSPTQMLSPTTSSTTSTTTSLFVDPVSGKMFYPPFVTNFDKPIRSDNGARPTSGSSDDLAALPKYYHDMIELHRMSDAQKRFKDI